MKLTFLGATHEVTGSCYYLEACGQKILIDCGMEQGADWFENKPLPVQASDLDCILLTHAHIDHSGKLPLLCREGFQGEIFSTEGTAQLCGIMLMDSAHIQESEAAWKNRKAMRAGTEQIKPMYTIADAQAALKCFVGIPYDREKRIAEGIVIRFVDAGHLLGSASIEMTITERSETGAEVTKKLIFSGDIGNTGQPLIKDPTYLTGADYVVMESTYGDRSHEKPADYAAELSKILQSTFDRGGNVIIPSFAVGRTQEMLYFIRKIKGEKLVKGHDGFEVWVDSPLAVEATNVFYKRMYSDFDEEAERLISQGINPIGFDGLRTAVTSEDSKSINTEKNVKVILSSSGMCEAGRIRHHLKYNLWRPESTVLFVGYQGEGTLGRKLLDGAASVKLFGEEISVKARICQLPGISGHADNQGLLSWIGAMKDKPAKVFVTHGDDKVCELFRDRLIKELGMDAYAPYSGTQFDLAAGTFIEEAPPVRLREKNTAQKQEAVTGSEVSAADEQSGAVGSPYAHLLSAGRRLLELIRSKEGGQVQEQKTMAREINDLCNKWGK